MSRCFRMEVKVSKFNPKRYKDICDVLLNMWGFDPLDMPGKKDKVPKELILSGEDNLTGGKSDDEFANDLAQAVWKANGRYCEVEVISTYLEVTPPSDIHTWTKGDYQEWLATNREITNADNQDVPRSIDNHGESERLGI